MLVAAAPSVWPPAPPLAATSLVSLASAPLDTDSAAPRHAYKYRVPFSIHSLLGSAPADCPATDSDAGLGSAV